MRRLTLLGCLFLAVSLRGSAAAAQACLGLASFADGAVHVNFAVEFPDSATAYALGIGAGRHNHVFGNLGVGRVTYEDLEGTSTLGFLEFGYQLPIGPAQLCPIAGGSFQVGPDDDVAGIEVTARAVSAGVALGLPLDVGFLTIVPNTAVKYDHVSVKFAAVDVGSTTETSSGGGVDLGLGLSFGHRVTVQPIVHIPLAGDDDEITYGMFLSLSFRWPPR